MSLTYVIIMPPIDISVAVITRDDNFMRFLVVDGLPENMTSGINVYTELDDKMDSDNKQEIVEDYNTFNEKKTELYGHVYNMFAINRVRDLGLTVVKNANNHHYREISTEFIVMPNLIDALIQQSNIVIWVTYQDDPITATSVINQCRGKHLIVVFVHDDDVLPDLTSINEELNSHSLKPVIPLSLDYGFKFRQMMYTNEHVTIDLERSPDEFQPFFDAFNDLIETHIEEYFITNAVYCLRTNAPDYPNTKQLLSITRRHKFNTQKLIEALSIILNQVPFTDLHKFATLSSDEEYQKIITQYSTEHKNHALATKASLTFLKPVKMLQTYKDIIGGLSDHADINDLHQRIITMYTTTIQEQTGKELASVFYNQENRNAFVHLMVNMKAHMHDDEYKKAILKIMLVKLEMISKLDKLYSDKGCDRRAYSYAEALLDLIDQHCNLTYETIMRRVSVICYQIMQSLPISYVINQTIQNLDGLIEPNNDFDMSFETHVFATITHEHDDDLYEQLSDTDSPYHFETSEKDNTYV